jgi:uncharacterized protein (DUF2141 family)
MGRIFDSGRKIGLAVALVLLPMAAGGGILLGSTGAGAVSCVPGVGEQIQAVFNATPATQAAVASPGDVLEYQVVLSVNAAPSGCDFSNGTLNLITPDGSIHVLATGVTVAAGTTKTFFTNNNVVGASPVNTPFTYTVNAADIGATNGDPGGAFLPPGNIDVWSSVSGTSGTATGHASPDFYTEVVFQPALSTSEISSSPQVAPASFTDSATLTSLNKAATAAGSVAYNLYSGNSSSVCTGTPVQTLNETVAAGAVPNATFTGVSAGNYEIQAVYSGDPLTFNLGATSACGTEPFTVNAQPGLTTTEISPTPQTGPASFTDSATLTGLNSSGTAAGTVTYNLYAGTNSSACTGTPLQAVTEPVTAGVATNGTFTSVTAGHYEIQAVYSGDAATFNLGATSACAAEAFTINAQPTLTTTEVTSSPQVAPASFTDSATLTGLNLSGTATGTVTYNLYAGNSGSVCTGTPLQAVTEPVTAGVVTNATFTSVGVGNYEIQAVYSGDAATLNLGATSTCGSEAFTVAQAMPGVTTQLSSGSVVVGTSFTDTATVHGGTTPTGTVTFNVYTGSSGTSCTGTPVATNTQPLVSGSATSGAFSLGVGSYEVQAVYSGDGNNAAASSACGSEPVAVTPAAPTVTTQLSSSSVNTPASFTDTATVHGGTSPTGTVTFNVYTGSSSTSCVGTPIATSANKALVSGSATSGAFTLSAGSYEVQAVYSGDGSNAGASSACGTEPVSVHTNFTANLTPGFWKNHSAATSALLPLNLGNYVVNTFAKASAVLTDTGCGGGRLNCMNVMLLAAELNLAQGGSTCIVTNGVLAQANNLDIKYHYNGPGTYLLTAADNNLAQTLHDELSNYDIDGVPTC